MPEAENVSPKKAGLRPKTALAQSSVTGSISWLLSILFYKLIAIWRYLMHTPPKKQLQSNETESSEINEGNETQFDRFIWVIVRECNHLDQTLKEMYV